MKCRSFQKVVNIYFPCSALHIHTYTKQNTRNYTRRWLCERFFFVVFVFTIFFFILCSRCLFIHGICVVLRFRGKNEIKKVNAEHNKNNKKMKSQVYWSRNFCTLFHHSLLLLVAPLHGVCIAFIKLLVQKRNNVTQLQLTWSTGQKKVLGGWCVFTCTFAVIDGVFIVITGSHSICMVFLWNENEKGENRPENHFILNGIDSEIIPRTKGTEVLWLWVESFDLVQLDSILCENSF